MTADGLRQSREAELDRQSRLKNRIACCSVAGCLAGGGDAVRAALAEEVKAQGASAEIEVCGTGCMGLCSRGPLVRSSAGEITYAEVKPGDAAAVVRSDLDSLNGRILRQSDPFFAGQRRLILANSGKVDPEKIAGYIAQGGYQSLLRATSEMTPEEIVAEVKKSKLRGRGGAGYPAGLKWELVARHPSATKYVICNADEGDPGAFMNRSVLEGDPHRVLEGMAIAGRAVGAQQGYIYARGESPLAIERIRTAIDQAQREGLLGGRVFDSDFHFRIDLRIGAGAYVCGEETALIASIEGKRGQPVLRPPYPPESGLWGHPTLINNVETFANIPQIIENGGDWFAGIGAPASPGTKIFAVAGRIRNSGLVEVPIGTSLRTILFEIGGGVPEGYEFKAAQTGGPAGGCIPAQYLDVPMDYDSLTGIGTMMGSGGLIVMDTSSCMVDVARFFMEFCMDESCGKCIPCRAGTVQMNEILGRMTSGEGKEADFAMLEALSGLLVEASLCGLGRAAPNPVLSTLRHFRSEYDAHVRERRCPAGSCRMGASA
ncbi:MAG: NADH-quinone oxidoreductase subunit L [Acidobacteriia bacterium]|nr:NADH-quinone oxidoreductase subunit L [Terriglobia bacterium]